MEPGDEIDSIGRLVIVMLGMDEEEQATKVRISSSCLELYISIPK
jgi:hypothetical protein